MAVQDERSPGTQLVPVDPTRPGPSRARAWSVTGMAVRFIVVNWANKAILGIAAQPLMQDLGLTPADIGSSAAPSPSGSRSPAC
ncbi:hypothetical protein [Pseudonocardia xishanensis]|uniref:MFS transporter n=1 Tax=Pseudonocardia xishanensis TaxID=630995 RepID=A0ABP8RV84_9PSEU